jgi:hypothetical protein
MATIQASDVLPVRSRISWSAVLAGAVIALTAYLILTILGVATGLSLSNRVSGNAMAIGAGIWTIVTMLIALFIGGCVCSRCTAGENKTEAAMGGVVVWGVFFLMLAWLSTGALNTGLHAVFGTTNTAALTGVNFNNWTDEDLKKEFGISQTSIDKMRSTVNKAVGRTRDAVEGTSPADVRRSAKAAAWWTLTGIILSLAAAVIGGLVGAGPTLIITSLRLRGATVAATAPPPAREPVNR